MWWIFGTRILFKDRKICVKEEQSFKEEKYYELENDSNDGDQEYLGHDIKSYVDAQDNDSHIDDEKIENVCV